MDTLAAYSLIANYSAIALYVLAFLAFVGDPVDAAGAAQIRLADEHLQALIGAAGAGHVVRHPAHGADLHPGFLQGFPAHQVGHRLAVLVGEAGHQFQAPGGVAPFQGADAKLLDQQDLAAHRIVFPSSCT